MIPHKVTFSPYLFGLISYYSYFVHSGPATLSSLNMFLIQGHFYYFFLPPGGQFLKYLLLLLSFFSKFTLIINSNLTILSFRQNVMYLLFSNLFIYYSLNFCSEHFSFPDIIYSNILPLNNPSIIVCFVYCCIPITQKVVQLIVNKYLLTK